MVKWSQAKFVDAMLEVHGLNLKVIGTYIDNASRVKIKCTGCGHEWSPKPRDLIHKKSGCPACVKMPLRTTTAEYKNKLHEINPDVECTQEYIGYTSLMWHRCLKCQHRWRVTPNNTLFGHGCPACKVESNSFQRKSFQLGTRNVKVQGYEPQALQYIIDRGANPQCILVSTREGKPSVKYRYGGKDRIYVADFYHTKRNRLIEVKSIFTIGLARSGALKDKWEETKTKAKASMAQGYDFVLMLMNEKGERIALPKDWHCLSRKQILKFME